MTRLSVREPIPNKLRKAFHVANDLLGPGLYIINFAPIGRLGSPALYCRTNDRFEMPRLPDKLSSTVLRGEKGSNAFFLPDSKADGSQVCDLQRDALLAAGVDSAHIYQDQASGKKDDRPGLTACLKALREGDTLLVWKLDRLGRDLRHLINTVHDLTGRGIGLKVLTGQGAAIDTTTAAGKLVFGIFAALSEFERELISERTVAGLASARARGKKGGRTYKMTASKLRLALAAMGQPETTVGNLCKELGITRQTLYRHVSPNGELRTDGVKLLSNS